MKLSEIYAMFDRENKCVSITEEEALIHQLETADWKAEFSDNVDRIDRGVRHMAKVENWVYQFWRRHPERAIELWNQYSPASAPGITPSFIITKSNESI